MRGRVDILWFAVSALSLGAGCGDPLISDSAYETPLFSFQPSAAELYEIDSLDGLSAGVVWVDPLQVRDDLPHPARGMTVRRRDREFSVDLFTPPPDAAIRRLPDPATGAVAVSFAFGEIVVYADRDGDGRFALASRAQGLGMLPPDEYAGSTNNVVVIYVETPARPGGLVATNWFTLFEPPGYRLAVIGCAQSSISPPVRTLTADPKFTISLAPEASPDRIVTRECLSSAPVPVTSP